MLLPSPTPPPSPSPSPSSSPRGQPLLQQQLQLGDMEELFHGSSGNKSTTSSSSVVAAQEEDKNSGLRRGPWTVDEDRLLMDSIASRGEGRWNSLARSAGLKRTGKSCRLRWLNYLRPDVRRGNITPEEQLLILDLHSRWGNRWSKIAERLPGRTDNEIKNYWRTRVQKHARQLRCDVNSKHFKDLMRYLWMPRLLERIHLQYSHHHHHHHHHRPPPQLPDQSSTPNNNNVVVVDTSVAAGSVDVHGSDSGVYQLMEGAPHTSSSTTNHINHVHDNNNIISINNYNTINYNEAGCSCPLESMQNQLEIHDDQTAEEIDQTFWIGVDDHFQLPQAEANWGEDACMMSSACSDISHLT